jgi:hypothetical protein
MRCIGEPAVVHAYKRELTVLEEVLANEATAKLFAEHL